MAEAAVELKKIVQKRGDWMSNNSKFLSLNFFHPYNLISLVIILCDIIEFFYSF